MLRSFSFLVLFWLVYDISVAIHEWSDVVGCNKKKRGKNEKRKENTREQEREREEKVMQE
jgi:hypothetical protein